MVQFTEFELNNTDVIYGGDLIPSVIYHTNGYIDRDVYDTHSARMILLEQ